MKKWFKGDKIGVLCVDYTTGGVDLRKPVFRIKPMFAWYDMWIGIFIDRKNRHIYVFPLPMFGFKIGYQ